MPSAVRICLLRRLMRFQRSLCKKSANSAAAVPMPGAVGWFLLRPLLQFRRSLSKQSANSDAAVPVSGAVGTFLLRLRLSFRRSLSKKNQQSVPRRLTCPVLLGGFAETYVAISEKSQQKNQQTISQLQARVVDQLKTRLN